MSSVVALKQFAASAAGFTFTVLPGDIFRSTEYSAAAFAALLAAGAAVSGGNGLTSWDSPHPALVAARAAVMDLRARGGLDPDGSNGSILMLDGSALDVASNVTTGTATLVASTVDVTVTPPADGAAAVPVGSSVYATVTTPGGKPKLLSAVRLSDTQIRISSPGSGFGALLASAGVDGTLVAGADDITLANLVGDQLAVIRKVSAGTPGVLSVKRKSATEVTVESWQEPVTALATLIAGALDVTLANLVGDRLSVEVVTPHGTPGVLSVKRKSATEVTVQSWLAGTGIEALDISDVRVINEGAAVNPDTSDVTVFNFGQTAAETSLVRWAVVRP